MPASKQSGPPPSRYKIPSLEGNINRVIGFLFYYRLVFVLLLIFGIIYLNYQVWQISAREDQLKNLAVVFTCGSIIIGIFYSIINYEHNLSKFKHDKRLSRETLTFSTACKMYDEATISHFRTLREFHQNNNELFDQSGFIKIYEKMHNENPEVRTSFVIVFNYFEGISIGIEQGIMDEEFMRSFFKTIFQINYMRYGKYIEFWRAKDKVNTMFLKYTNLAQKWENGN